MTCKNRSEKLILLTYENLAEKGGVGTKPQDERHHPSGLFAEKLTASNKCRDLLGTYLRLGQHERKASGEGGVHLDSPYEKGILMGKSPEKDAEKGMEKFSKKKRNLQKNSLKIAEKSL